VESDLGRTEEARRVVASSLAPLQVHRVDTLILGCTHYPLIADLIGEVMGKDVQLISSAEETARELKILLQRKKLLSPEDEGRPLSIAFSPAAIPIFSGGSPNGGWVAPSMSPGRWRRHRCPAPSDSAKRDSFSIFRC